MDTQNTILYVEDNTENRVLIRRILQSEGYSVLEAENAQRALSVVKSHPPDLILMDMNLPEIDGYSLTCELKGIPALKAVPILAVTANVMKGDREKTLEAGCDGYIQKPIDIDLLLLEIDRFLSIGR